MHGVLILHVQRSAMKLVKDLEEKPYGQQLRALVGEVAAEQLERSASHDPRGVSAALRVCFTCLMKSEKEVFGQQLGLLVERISQQGG